MKNLLLCQHKQVKFDNEKYVFVKIKCKVHHIFRSFKNVKVQ